MQKITPFLWFNDNAEEAMNFYVATFKKPKLIKALKSILIKIYKFKKIS